MGRVLTSLLLILVLLVFVVVAGGVLETLAHMVWPV